MAPPRTQPDAIEASTRLDEPEFFTDFQVGNKRDGWKLVAFRQSWRALKELSPNCCFTKAVVDDALDLLADEKLKAGEWATLTSQNVRDDWQKTMRTRIRSSGSFINNATCKGVPVPRWLDQLWSAPADEGKTAPATVGPTSNATPTGGYHGFFYGWEGDEAWRAPSSNVRAREFTKNIAKRQLAE